MVVSEIDGTYGSSNGEDRHCDKGNVLTVPQVYSLEQIHIRHTVCSTCLLESATVDSPLSIFAVHFETSAISNFETRYIDLKLILSSQND